MRLQDLSKASTVYDVSEKLVGLGGAPPYPSDSKASMPSPVAA